MAGGGVPGAGGCKGLILLRPLNSPVRHLPQQATCGWFWVPFAIKRYMNQQSAGCVFWRFLGRQKAAQKPTGTMKKPERHGLTLAPGDYSRVCKQTVPGARIFSPHLSFRFFHQAGIRHLVNLLMNMKKSSASNVRSAELNPNLLASLRPQNPVLNRALFADSKRAKTRRRSTRIQGPETP